MISLLGSLLGLLGSTIPNIFNIYKEKKDREHEITLLQLQMQQQAQGHSERLEEIGANADIAESSAIYRTYTTNIVWVDALNGTVRPVITYAMFTLYMTVKGVQVVAAYNNLVSWNDVWTEEDWCILSTVISFYFGQRAMTKFSQRNR
jgi:hypothetical protein